MYSISEAKLAENNWTVSKTYDSFFIKCPRSKLIRLMEIEFNLFSLLFSD